VVVREICLILLLKEAGRERSRYLGNYHNDYYYRKRDLGTVPFLERFKERSSQYLVPILFP